VEQEKQIASGVIGDLGENVRMVGKDERNSTEEIIAMDQGKKVDHVLLHALHALLQCPPQKNCLAHV